MSVQRAEERHHEHDRPAGHAVRDRGDGETEDDHREGDALLGQRPGLTVHAGHGPHDHRENEGRGDRPDPPAAELRADDADAHHRQEVVAAEQRMQNPAHETVG
jgi:hypothetical protein